MSDELINNFISNLDESEERASEEMYQQHVDRYALNEDQIMSLFHGNVDKVKERIKDVEDIHVKQTPGGKFSMSRYSEERELEEQRRFNELKQQNEELRQQNEQLHKDFNELKELINEKLK